jgi:hypothetical protein
VDRLDEFYLKLLEVDQELRTVFINAAGGSGEFALVIAQKFGIEISAKDAAHVLGLSPSGSRKRIGKIKGKKAPESDTESVQIGPKVTRKRPLRKRPK